MGLVTKAPKQPTSNRPAEPVTEIKPDPSCTICKGDGNIRSTRPSEVFAGVEDDYRTPCRCVKRQQVARRVRAFDVDDLIETKKLPINDTRPLFHDGCHLKSFVWQGEWHGDGPQVAGWMAATLCHHLFGVVGSNVNWAFEVLTDQELLQAAFEKAREDGQYVETQYDMIDPDAFDLIVLRLGYVGNKHASASGILLECIQKRLFARKPTWIHVPDDYGEAYHGWDPKLERVLQGLPRHEIT